MRHQKILVSSLGESPSVVTEAIDKLEAEEGIEFDQVITIGTWHDKARQSADLLRSHLPEHYGERIFYCHYYPQHDETTRPVIDPITPEDNILYLMLAAETLRGFQRCENLYVSLAGGRKAMSALMVMAAQIYGVKKLCHVVHRQLDEYLERMMDVENLNRAEPEEQKELLHPELTKIVATQLPLVSLFPLATDFRRALEGDQAIDVTAQRLLVASRLLTEINGQWLPTDAGQQLRRILNDIEELPEPSDLAPNEKEMNLHGLSEHDDLRLLAERLRYFQYAQGVVTAENQSQISFARSFYTPYGRLLLEANPERPDTFLITVAKPSEAPRLRVFTTAQTMKQAERVQRSLKQFLGWEV
ncbi:MAG TPA: CRISPR-associated ring nuclease [Blastocatellia bacterium]|nr:CRISPR-associated ring nuclease [Blastocatellia bacterium]